jgi:response regulator RpfG family c-di-GMP phosphodiesterase
MNYKLLIVDDEAPNRRLLERLFSRDYDCLTASSGPEAMRVLEQHDVAILITDQRMPEMTGIDLLKRTAHLRPNMVRILLTGYTDVETLVEAINSGLVYMYVTKPWNNDELKLKVNRAVEHYEANKKRSSLIQANERLLLRIKEMKLGIVTALTDMLRTRDERRYEHALRVRKYSTAIADRMDFSDEEKGELSAAALLHNFGFLDSAEQKVAGKPTLDIDPLVCCTDSRGEARILSAIAELGNVAEILRSHRENFDGTGYPTGIKGDHISVSGRILRVADEYDLLTLACDSDSRISHDEAVKSIVRRSGKEFDPEVVTVIDQISHDRLIGWNSLEPSTKLRVRIGSSQNRSRASTFGTRG